MIRLTIFEMNVKAYAGCNMIPFNPDQDLAIDYALERDGCNVFARPGKGKTRIALDVIEASQCRTLVIAPLFPALTSWPNENKKWGYDFNMRVLHGKEKKIGTEDVTVINYDALTWLRQRDLSSYELVVYDEVHKLKSPGTQRFRRWRSTAQKFKYRLGLTGTPMGNNLYDLWGQMFVIDFGESLGRTISGPKGFEKTYFERDPYTYAITPRDGARETIYNQIKERAISLDFYDGEMPELLHNIVPITLPSAARTAYEEMQKSKRIKDTDVIAVNAGVRSMKLRQIAAGAVYDDDGDVLKLHKAKQDALKRLVDELQGDPVIVFIQFQHDITAIHDVLGPKVPVIDGRTSAESMVKIVNEWNAGHIPVLIAHPVKAGIGGNMQTGGHNICFYTLPWSLGDIEQAVGRVWRQGQESDQCIVHYLTCTNTKDEEVAEAARDKKTDQDDLFKELSR